MIRAGELTEWLNIQTTAATSDGQGGTSAGATTTVARVPAQMIARGATEILQAESVGSHAGYQFRIRVRPDVTAGMTVAWVPKWPPSSSTTTLQILGVQPEPDRQSMMLTCAVVQ